MKIYLYLLSIIFAVSLSGCSKNSVQPLTSSSLELMVSNQSSVVDPANIRILIDGNEAVNDNFNHGTGHSWQTFSVQLSPGRHVLKAETSSGAAFIEKEFVLTNEKHYIGVDYFNSSTQGESFAYIFSDIPLGVR
jgi:hypothetical protein